MKIRKYITLNLMALVSYIHLWQTVFIYESFPFIIWSNRPSEIFEAICHYNVYKFQLQKDFINEIFWIVLFVLFLKELVLRHKYPDKLKEFNIKNKTLNIIHGIFFYFSYVYMGYILSIYLIYLFVFLFVISIILTS